MKNLKHLFFFCFTLVSMRSFAQSETNVDYFFKFKANNVTYKTLFLKPNDKSAASLFVKYLKDSTIAVRGFERQTDSIVIYNNTAEFRFNFFKANKPQSSKEIYLPITDKFSLSPKEYKVADYDIGGDISFEKRNDYYDGLAEYNIHSYKLFSYQYPWVHNRRQAKFKVTKVDTVAKTISGNFSFTVTYAEEDGNTITNKKETYKKVIEADITEGEFCLPYTIVVM